MREDYSHILIRIPHSRVLAQVLKYCVLTNDNIGGVKRRLDLGKMSLICPTRQKGIQLIITVPPRRLQGCNNPQGFNDHSVLVAGEV